MIRFTYNGAVTDQIVDSHPNSIAAAAAAIANWGQGITVQAYRNSADLWIIIAQGETVTAEVLP